MWGTLSLIEVTREAPAADAETSADDAPRGRLGRRCRRLAPDWSDLLCELELDSSDHVPRAALLGAPMNPTRNPDAIALRFRVSGKQGYGVSPVMARRCFERMDAEGITGQISVLYDLSDTENAGHARASLARRRTLGLSSSA